MRWAWIAGAALAGAGLGALAGASLPASATEFAAFGIDEVLAKRKELNRSYHEFLKKPSMRCAVFVLPRGAVDQQTPHETDELYYVLRGRATLRVGTGAGIEDVECRKGSVLFVGAGVEHRFVNIEEDLEMLVIFSEKQAPALPER
ncbi:MAG: cupin domain-containing protein [Phycisphaerales bacterium JB039]